MYMADYIVVFLQTVHTFHISYAQNCFIANWEKRGNIAEKNFFTTTVCKTSCITV